LLQQLQQHQQQPPPPKKNTAKLLANEIAELNQKGIYNSLNLYKIEQTNIITLYVCVFVIYIKIVNYIDM
jgi:hypothetical protein